MAIYGSYSNTASATTLGDPILLPHLELYLSSILGMSGYTNGQAITNWPDQSGNARDAVTAGGGLTNPTYSTVSLSPAGKNTVTFADVLTTMTNGSNFDWVGARGHTIYWYGKPTLKTAPPYDFVNQILFAPATTGKPAVLVSTGVAGKYGFNDDAGGGAPKVFGTSASIYDAYHLHTIVLPLPNNNTVPGLYYLDGVLVAQTGGNANYQCAIPSADKYLLGNGSSLNVTFKGQLGFLLMFSDTHLQATISDVYSWAVSTWGF